MAVPTTRATFKEYCLKNKYSNWYFNIIETALNRGWTKKTAPCYVEKHHYIPSSLGGSDEQTVFLTSKEHFICHVLLTKILIGEDKAKMIWTIMCLKGKNRYINSRIYSQFKSQLKHSDESKFKMSLNRQITQVGERNNNYGNRGCLNPLYGRKQTLEHKQKRISKLIGRKQSDSAKLKMSLNRPHGPSGKKWFNNGTKETYDLPENKPATWAFGRLKRG
jgi:hypothetical protein